jgi:hypothetical protein
MRPSTDDRKAQLMARTSDTALIEALSRLDATMKPETASAEQRMVRAWTIDEIERRWPVAAEAVGRAFNSAAQEEETTGQYVEVDYVAILLGNVPQHLLPVGYGAITGGATHP